MMTRLNSYDISVYLCGSCLIDPLVFLSVPNPDQPVSFSAEPDPWWCAGSSTRSVHPNLGSAAATMLRVSVPHRNHSLSRPRSKGEGGKANSDMRPVPSRRERRTLAGRRERARPSRLGALCPPGSLKEKLGTNPSSRQRDLAIAVLGGARV